MFQNLSADGLGVLDAFADLLQEFVQTFGDHVAAIAVLEKSMPPRTRDEALNFFILAMAHERLGNREQARGWFDQGIQWRHNSGRYFVTASLRAEAAELLGILAPPRVVPAPAPPAK